MVEKTNPKHRRERSDQTSLNGMSRQQFSGARPKTDADRSFLALAADDDGVAVLQELPLLAGVHLQRDGLGSAPAELQHGAE